MRHPCVIGSELDPRPMTWARSGGAPYTRIGFGARSISFPLSAIDISCVITIRIAGNHSPRKCSEATCSWTLLQWCATAPTLCSRDPRQTILQDKNDCWPVVARKLCGAAHSHDHLLPLASLHTSLDKSSYEDRHETSARCLHPFSASKEARLC